MDEKLDLIKGILTKLIEITGDVRPKAMLEWNICNEKILKIGDYISSNQRNIAQAEQIYEFLKSINNLFDEFIKDLD